MDWIAGTARNGNRELCVQAQWLDGGEVITELRAMKADLHFQGQQPARGAGAGASAGIAVRRKVALPLHELRPGSAQEYLEGLGLAHLEESGQPVYEAMTDAGRMLIPAQLLVLATLGANSQFRQVLLRPWGPEFLMSACAELGAQQLTLRPTPNRMLRLQLEHPAIAAKLEWVLSYPSAAAAWGSVYRNALEGVFDMRMPKALATVSAWALPVDGTLLVTRLELLTLTPAEEPHPFATAQAKREFVFNNSVHRRPTHGKAAAPTRDLSLAAQVHDQPSPTAGTLAVNAANILADTEAAANSGAVTRCVPKITDEQWLRIEPLLTSTLKPIGGATSGAPRAHTLRELIDAIRLKLGTPYSWSKLPVAPKCMQGATVLLSKLKRAGVWAAIAWA